jgi:hypothetical protein
MKDGIRNPPNSENKKTPPPAPDNHGPTYWGGDGARTDLHKLNPGDRDGGGGDILRNMIKQKMNSSPQGFQGGGRIVPIGTDPSKYKNIQKYQSYGGGSKTLAIKTIYMID